VNFDQGNADSLAWQIGPINFSPKESAMQRLKVQIEAIFEIPDNAELVSTEDDLCLQVDENKYSPAVTWLKITGDSLDDAGFEAEENVSLNEETVSMDLESE
jgi:hypothetical protein